MSPPLTGLVLCGGTSRRLGRDKALVRVDGEALIDRVVARLRTVCDPVWVAPGDDPARLAGRADATVLDDPAGAGPLAGLLAGLAAAPTDAVAVCAVDHPYVAAALLGDLATHVAGHDAAIPVVAGRLQPLHAVWTRAATPVIRQKLTGGTRAVHAVLDELDWIACDAGVWAAHDPHARFAIDVDTPTDLAALTRGPAECQGFE